MLVQARAQILGFGVARGVSRGDGDIDRRQGVLVQTEGLSCEAFDAVASDCGAESARRYAQAQSRVGFMIGQDRYSKIRITKFFALPVQGTKFGRLV